MSFENLTTWLQANLTDDKGYPVLIGSRAIETFTLRDTSKSDYDLTMTANQFSKWRKANPDMVISECKVNIIGECQISCQADGAMFDIFLIASEKTESKMERHFGNNKLWALGQTMTNIKSIPTFLEVKVADVHLLEAIKTSHIYHGHNWDKHIQDLHLFRRFIAKDRFYLIPNKASVEPQRREDINAMLLAKRKDIDTIKGEPGKDINLNQTNEKFLEDDVLYIDKFIKHDDIHELVKFNDKPMHDYIRKDLTMAKCDKAMFESLSLEKRIQCVQEEAMVLALERGILPKLILDQDQAYAYAVKRICTNVTKGWFRKFAVDNYPAIITRPKDLRPFKKTIMESYDKSRNVNRIALNENLKRYEFLLDYMSIDVLNNIGSYLLPDERMISFDPALIKSSDFILTFNSLEEIIDDSVSDKDPSYREDGETINDPEVKRYQLNLYSKGKVIKIIGLKVTNRVIFNNDDCSGDLHYIHEAEFESDGFKIGCAELAAKVLSGQSSSDGQYARSDVYESVDSDLNDILTKKSESGNMLIEELFDGYVKRVSDEYDAVENKKEHHFFHKDKQYGKHLLKILTQVYYAKFNPQLEGKGQKLLTDILNYAKIPINYYPSITVLNKINVAGKNTLKPYIGGEEYGYYLINGY